MNNDNKFKVIEKVTKIVPVLMAFLVPIFFLPITTEFFSFNKAALIVIASLMLLVAWGTKILVGDKMEFTKSAIDKPLILFTIVTVLATVFSLNKDLSIFGGQGRWMGMFTTLMLIAFYFLVTPAIKDKKTVQNVLFALVVSSAISSFVSVLAYYKIYLGSATFVKLQNFSLTGSITDSIFLASLGITIAFSTLGSEKKMLKKIVLMSSIIINFFLIAVTKTSLGWITLLTGLISAIVMIKKSSLKNSKVEYLTVAGIVAALMFVTILPATKEVLVDANFPNEVKLPLRESWVVATSTVQNYPILATGPSSFQLNFPRYKTLAMNATDYWNVRFDKPFNEPLNILSTTGLVGILVATLLTYKVLKMLKDSKKAESRGALTSTVISTTLLILVGLMFTYGTVTNMFLLTLSVSLLVAIQAMSNTKGVSESMSIGVSSISGLEAAESTGVLKKEHFRYIFSIPVFLLAAYIGFVQYKAYAAEFYMRKALVAASNNDGSGTYEYQRRAIAMNPNRDVYHSAYANTNLALANTLASKENLTDTEKQTIQTLLAQSIRSTRVATEVLNPLNPSNWETRAAIYRSMVNLADNATEWAISAYNAAIQLDPTNPRLRLDLGGIYFASEDYLSAANQFRQATTLKQDYANAYYNFGQALVQLQDYANAKNALEITKALVPADSPDAQVLEQDLAALDELLAQSGATTEEDKPTVEELTFDEPTNTAGQEPLVNAGEEQIIEGENLDLGSLPEQEPAQEAPAENPEE